MIATFLLASFRIRCVFHESCSNTGCSIGDTCRKCTSINNMTFHNSKKSRVQGKVHRLQQVYIDHRNTPLSTYIEQQYTPLSTFPQINLLRRTQEPKVQTYKQGRARLGNFPASVAKLLPSRIFRKGPRNTRRIALHCCQPCQR